MSNLQAIQLEAQELEPPEPFFDAFAEPEPFPIDAFPYALRAGVLGIVGVVQCAVALATQSVLAAAALIAQAHINVQLIHGQISPVSLFLITVAGTGERKSSADKLATRVIRMIQAELVRAHRLAVRRHENEVAAWQARRKQIIDEAEGAHDDALQTKLDDLGDRPEPPVMPIFLFEEPTFEGIVKFLRLGLGYGGLFSAEGGQFVFGHAMNKDNRMKTSTALSTLWEAETITRVRAGEDITALQNRRLSLNLMFQPGVADNILGDGNLRDQGFLSRTLAAWPQSTMGSRKFAEASREHHDALAAYDSMMTALMGLQPVLVADTKNELQPRLLQLHPEARDLLIAFYDWGEPLISEDGPLYPIKGLAAKAAEHAARIAGIFTFVEAPGADEVTPANMERAITVTRWYLNEGLRIAQALQVPPAVVDAEKIRVWLNSDSCLDDIIKLQRIQQYGPLRKRKGELEPAIKLLEKHRHLLPVMENGKALRSVWRVNRAVAP